MIPFIDVDLTPTETREALRDVLQGDFDPADDATRLGVPARTGQLLAVGSHTTDARELDDTLMHRSVVLCGAHTQEVAARDRHLAGHQVIHRIAVFPHQELVGLAVFTVLGIGAVVLRHQFAVVLHPIQRQVVGVFYSHPSYLRRPRCGTRCRSGRKSSWRSLPPQHHGSRIAEECERYRRAGSSN